MLPLQKLQYGNDEISKEKFDGKLSKKRGVDP
jgi:hypothetical protein